MTKLVYTVTTATLEVFENVPTLARAKELVAELGGTYKAVYIKGRDL